MFSLLRWQWDGYPRYHRSRANLVLHIFVVPMFLAGNLALVTALLQGSWVLALLSIGLSGVSIVLQGLGHRREPVPPEPFTSPVNPALRILCEQWITFPRFVLSGGWFLALRSAT